ncbi:MAG TPA: zf-HC2 domain-containing protein [Terracidiphilus sp.]|nr:zf-HC2 domain-containing protein [Terracidiphilus sp.]
MKVESHEEFRLLIDRSFAGGISREDAATLREHLNTCTACRKHEDVSTRMVAALSGFAFEAAPGLDAQVHRSMENLLQEMETVAMERRRSLMTSAAAFLLSFLGSLLLGGPADLLASSLHFAHGSVQFGLWLFWIMPSLLAATFIPVLSTSLRTVEVRRGLTP